MIRRAGVVAGIAALLCLVPGTASADVIFDPADADELAATLAEAHQAQGVCYGWEIIVDNVSVIEDSVGSNFGAGRSALASTEADSCSATVVLHADIVWTAETSELEDSASYSVSSSNPAGPTTDDLDDLDLISTDGLVGEEVDVDVYKAVAALPLLAADAGIADPIEATPAAEPLPGDAQATNSPGSDFWRSSGMQVLWGALILLAAVVFGVYAIKSSRRAPPVVRSVPRVPPYVPPEWTEPRGTGEDPPDADTPGDRPPSTS